MGHQIGLKQRHVVVEVGNSGKEIHFYYRPATMKESVSHDEKSYKIKGNRIKSSRTKETLKLGIRLLTGVRKGDIEYPDPKNPEKWLTLDTESMLPKEWKKILMQLEPDMMLQVAQLIVNAGVKAVGEDDDEDEGLDLDSLLDDDDDDDGEDGDLTADFLEHSDSAPSAMSKTAGDVKPAT